MSSLSPPVNKRKITQKVSKNRSIFHDLTCVSQALQGRVTCETTHKTSIFGHFVLFHVFHHIFQAIMRTCVVKNPSQVEKKHVYLLVFWKWGGRFVSFVVPARRMQKWLFLVSHMQYLNHYAIIKTIFECDTCRVQKSWKFWNTKNRPKNRRFFIVSRRLYKGDIRRKMRSVFDLFLPQNTQYDAFV